MFKSESKSILFSKENILISLLVSTIFCLFIIISSKSNSNDCLTKKELNIGFIENSYIDYKY